MTTMTHADSFVRTAAGKAEIRARALALSRSARNLLMIIDATSPGDDWVAKVSGCSAGDLAQLVAAGLVEPWNGAPVRTFLQRVPVESALRDWSYDALYTLLTQAARERFGLIKGYKLILQIEGCTDLAGMRSVTLRFIEQLQKVHGEESAARFRKQLGATE